MTASHTQMPRMSPREALRKMPGQIVLVLQGGGALGAYQAGVYQALHEAGIEPDWVIGTSIGALNGAIIAGNAPEHRLDKLRNFWRLVERKGIPGTRYLWPPFQRALANLETLVGGIPGFFSPNPFASLGVLAPVGADRAALYSAEPLKETLIELVDFERLNTMGPRFTVGAVQVRSGEMVYFDSRSRAIGLEHVLASGALPPALSSVRVDGVAYWDGGIYSNTPIEIVFDDHPRRNSVVFAVQLWNPIGPEPKSIGQVLSRQKEIQYASRAKSHISRQQQIHHLRHVIRELVRRLPEEEQKTREVREFANYGCNTIMHIVQLLAPRNEEEDYTRDIDFTSEGIRARWEAGYADTARVLAVRPWERAVDPVAGVAVHLCDNTDTAGQVQGASGKEIFESAALQESHCVEEDEV